MSYSPTEAETAAQTDAPAGGIGRPEPIYGRRRPIYNRRNRMVLVNEKAAVEVANDMLGTIYLEHEFVSPDDPRGAMDCDLSPTGHCYPDAGTVYPDSPLNAAHESQDYAAVREILAQRLAKL